MVGIAKFAPRRGRAHGVHHRVVRQLGLYCLDRLGVRFNDEERDSCIAVFHYSGYLVGVAQDILCKTNETANRDINVGRLRAPVHGPESIIVANALMNSAPVTAVKPDPPPRQGLVKFIYRVSRAGNGRPAELPSSPSIGVLAFVCWQYSLMKKFVPKRSKPNSNFNNFTSSLAYLPLTSRASVSDCRTMATLKT